MKIGVYIVMEENKSGESSDAKCNAVSRNVSSDTLLSSLPAGADYEYESS